MAQVQRDSEKGDPSKSQKNAQHSALSAQANTRQLEGTVHFWGLLLRDFQATALTVNCKYIIKEMVILF